MSICRGLSSLMSLFGVFESLPRMLVPGQVILLPLLFANTMTMCSRVVQFGRPLVVFVMRSVVVTSGHSLKGPYLPGLGVSFPGKLVGAIRILQSSFCVPATPFVIPFFIVFGGSTVGACRKVMLLSRFPVCISHHHFLHSSSVSKCNRRTIPKGRALAM